jgi:hypothetical protein
MMKSRLAPTLQLGGAPGVTLALVSTEPRSWTSVSDKFLSNLPGERSKSGSEAGIRKSENPYSSRIFILGLPWLSLVGALPKLDVAGSAPVARSNHSRFAG